VVLSARDEGSGRGSADWSRARCPPEEVWYTAGLQAELENSGTAAIVAVDELPLRVHDVRFDDGFDGEVVDV